MVRMERTWFLISSSPRHETIAAQQLISIWSYINFFVYLLFILPVHVRVCVCLYMHEFICVHMLVHLCVHTCVHMSMCLCTCLHVCICARVCLHVHMPCHEFGGQKQLACHHAGLNSAHWTQFFRFDGNFFMGWLHAHDCNSEHA